MTSKKNLEIYLKKKQYTFEAVNCIICNLSNFELLSEKDRYGLSMSVVICVKCGLVQTTPRMTKNTSKEFYDNEYREIYENGVRVTERSFQAEYDKGKVINNFINDVIGEKFTKKFVVEIGTGALERLGERHQFIDAYRFRFYDHALGEPGWPAKPLLAAARAWLGNDHEYHELFLAGLLVAVHRRPPREARRHALGLIAGRVAEFTQNHITQHKRRPVVCAEVVAGAFWEAEAVPEHKYALSARVDGRHSFPGIPAPVHFPPETDERPRGAEDEEVDAAYERLAQDCGRLLLAARPELASGIRGLQHVHADAGRRPRGDGLIVTAGDALLPLGCVTPRDLACSPSLEYAGRLSDA